MHFVSKAPETCCALLTPDTLDAIFSYGKRLLDPAVGGLGTPFANAKRDNARLESDFEVNYLGAYDIETLGWRVEHKQWLLFVDVLEQIMTYVQVRCTYPQLALPFSLARRKSWIIQPSTLMEFSAFQGA